MISEENSLWPTRSDLRYISRRWAWIAAGGIAGLVLALVVVLLSPHEYSQTDTLLIETDASSGVYVDGAQSDALDALQSWNMAQSGNVYDVMTIIQSRRLLSDVVLGLDLQTTISARRALGNRELWGDERGLYLLTSQTAVDRNFSFKVDREEGDKLHVYSFRLDGKRQKLDVHTLSGREIETPAGKITLLDVPTSTRPTELKIEHVSLERATAELQRDITTSLATKDAMFINVTAKGRHPQKVGAVSDAVLRAYIDDVTLAKNERAERMERYIDVRLDSLGAQLNAVEAQLAVYRSNNQVATHEAQQQAYLSQQTSLESRIAQLQTSRTVVAHLRDWFVLNPDIDVMIPLQDGMEQSLLLRVNAYNTLLEQYVKVYQPEASAKASPIVKDLRDQLTAQRASIVEGVNNSARALDLQLQTLQGQQTRIAAALSSRPQGQAGYELLKQDQEVLAKLYLYDLNLREEVGLQLSIDVRNIRKVETGLTHLRGLRAHRAGMLKGGFFGGAVCVLLLLWLLSRYDWKLRDEHEVTELSDLNVVGRIPLCDEDDSDARQADEAMRIMHANVDFVRGGKNVVLITASSPRQGKSFVTLHLARAIAATGKRVLLIDSDIRKMTLTERMLGTTARAGLTDYLAEEETDLESLICHVNSGEQDFDLLAGGNKAPNPTELIQRGALNEVISYVSTTYDYVLIDSAPAFSIADTQIIAQYSDLTLFVVRLDMESRRFVQDLKEVTERTKLPGPQIVINGVKDTPVYGSQGNS